MKKKIAWTPSKKGHTIIEEVKKVLGFIDELEHIDTTLACTLVEGVMKPIESHSDLEAIVRGAMTAPSHDKDISSAKVHLTKAEECAHVAR